MTHRTALTMERTKRRWWQRNQANLVVSCDACEYRSTMDVTGCSGRLLDLKATVLRADGHIHERNPSYNGAA